jgi:hypothetical protein
MLFLPYSFFLFTNYILLLQTFSELLMRPDRTARVPLFTLEIGLDVYPTSYHPVLSQDQSASSNSRAIIAW